MADLNDDGHQDLVTGCYEGILYLIAGTGSGFAKPVPLRDKAGAYIHAGRYYDPATKKSGTAQGPTMRAFSGAPVDWDADGDLDLVLGTSEGPMLLRMNEGTARRPAFATTNRRIMAGDRAATIPSGHSMPVVADWDGDGRFDLVSGANDGSVYWLRNVGLRGHPEWRSPKQLVGKGRGNTDAPGRRSQVAVVDFDGNGDLDLLVGDYHRKRRGDGYERHGYVWVFFRRKPADQTVRRGGEAQKR